jgi:hypothetical protein
MKMRRASITRRSLESGGVCPGINSEPLHAAFVTKYYFEGLAPLKFSRIE